MNKMNSWPHTKHFFLNGGRTPTQEERDDIKIEAATESQGDTGNEKKQPCNFMGLH